MTEDKQFDLHIGKIKFFNRRKGYGFIVSEGINGDIFFHFSSMKNLQAEVFIGTDSVLNFELSKGVKGIFAKNINLVETYSNRQAVNYKKFVLFLGGIINEEIKNNQNKI